MCCMYGTRADAQDYSLRYPPGIDLSAHRLTASLGMRSPEPLPSTIVFLRLSWSSMRQRETFSEKVPRAKEQVIDVINSIPQTGTRNTHRHNIDTFKDPPSRNQEGFIITFRTQRLAKRQPIFHADAKMIYLKGFFVGFLYLTKRECSCGYAKTMYLSYVSANH